MENHSIQKQQKSVNQLIRFCEYMQQVLEIKLEILFLFPLFIKHIERQSPRASISNQCLDIGEQTVRHVQSVMNILTTLGGFPSMNDLPQSYGQQEEAISTFLFREEIASQILHAAKQSLAHEWTEKTQLRLWLQEKIETIHDESTHHAHTIERIVTPVDARFRDRILERFRVTALP